MTNVALDALCSCKCLLVGRIHDKLFVLSRAAKTMKRSDTKAVRRPHVTKLSFHTPKPGPVRYRNQGNSTLMMLNILRLKRWSALLKKHIGKTTRLCSNHFIDGNPTPSNPDPLLFLEVNFTNPCPVAIAH